MSGVGKGSIEIVIAIVGLVIVIALMVVGAVVATSGRGKPAGWFLGGVIAAIVTVLTLSYA